MIVAFGESVADVGIGAAGRPVDAALVLSATLGLALTATLWWAFFGTGDDDRAEETLTVRAAGQAAEARARRLLLRLHPDAARHRGERRRSCAPAVGHPGATLTAVPRWRSPAA